MGECQNKGPRRERPKGRKMSEMIRDGEFHTRDAEDPSLFSVVISIWRSPFYTYINAIVPVLNAASRQKRHC